MIWNPKWGFPFLCCLLLPVSGISVCGLWCHGSVLYMGSAQMDVEGINLGLMLVNVKRLGIKLSLSRIYDKSDIQRLN